VKKTLVVLTVAMAMIVGPSYAAAAEESDFAVTATYYMPGQDDDYDSGLGVDGQMRLWFADESNIGLAFSFGLASWQANEQQWELGLTDTATGTGAIAVSDGEVTLVAYGASLLFRPVHSESIALILECGARYVLVNSDIEFRIVAENVSGKDTMKIENGIIGTAGAELDIFLGDKISLFAGIGYQLDIVKGDRSVFDGIVPGENELKALRASAGLVVQY
jgi:hypothetical protein